MRYGRAAWLTQERLGDLVRAVHRGEPRALDNLLIAIRASLVAFFARRISPAVSEDLAQVALMRIARAVDRIDPERADRYLMTIAHNLLRTEFRRRARDDRREFSLDFAADVEAPIALHLEVEQKELARAIHRVSLETLPVSLRDIVLGLLRGLTPAEIAEQQHLNPVTIRTRLLRARALLRRELRPYLILEDGGTDDAAVPGIDD
ncbi:MAG: sigma-70 family RNA polymerase sigma factor [Gemmatimonadaceae bacterium]